jgi:hypothetical protein
MRFVLVNGMTPRTQPFCAICCDPIEDTYLREIATRLSYCDRKCYLGRSAVIVSAFRYHAKASHAEP